MRQDIVCPLQLDDQVPILLLHFLVAHMLWPVICHGCGLDDNILFCCPAGHFIKHVLCRFHRHNVCELRIFQCRLSGHQCHRSAPPCRHLCDRIPHFPGGMIRDIAHRINGFLRRSCCHKQPDPLHVLFTGKLLKDILQQQLRLRHFPCASIPARQIAHGRTDDFILIMDECLKIVLDHRIFEHSRIHRRCDHFFTFARHHCCGEHIVRNPVSKLADHISAGRCDHHHICLFRQGHVLYAELKIPVKCIDQTFVSRERLECDRIDKIRRILRHQDMNIRIQLLEGTCKIRRFIRRYTAGYSEKNCLAF